MQINRCQYNLWHTLKHTKTNEKFSKIADIVGIVMSKSHQQIYSSYDISLTGKLQTVNDTSLHLGSIVHFRQLESTL